MQTAGSQRSGFRQTLAWLLIALARTRFAGYLVRFGISRMNFIIPVQRLRETPHLLAFYHPSPSYPLHILIVPRKPYRSLLDLDPADREFQRDLFQTVQSLVREYNLEEDGYRLIANGGAFQDIELLHFHLISERPVSEKSVSEKRI